MKKTFLNKHLRPPFFVQSASDLVRCNLFVVLGGAGIDALRSVMASQDASQSDEEAGTQYPSQSSAFAGQRVWISPDFGKSSELYRWIVHSHSAALVEDIGEKDAFHLLPTFQGVCDLSLSNHWTLSASLG